MGKQNYHAVEVIPGKNCSCPISKLAGKRMLVSQIDDLLSLSSFFPYCTCTYKHYSDRRTGYDRRNFDIDTFSTTGQMRKMPYGRRVSDIHNRSRDRSLNPTTLVDALAS